MASADAGITVPPHILEALSAIHDARSSNDVRREASTYLEGVKAASNAPDWAYTLASDTSLPAEARHFGLTVLSHGVRYGFITEDADTVKKIRSGVREDAMARVDYSGNVSAAELEAEVQEAENLAVLRWTLAEEGRRLITARSWVEKLALGIRGSEPAFIRNTIARLWVDIAKKVWGGEENGWQRMDAALVMLWEGCSETTYGEVTENGNEFNPNGGFNGVEHRLDKVQFVLNVLENLSEDVFGPDDTSVGLRGTELGKACVDCFISTSVLGSEFPNRDSSGARAASGGSLLRCGREGWLSRICELLNWCFSAEIGLSEESAAQDKRLGKIKDTAMSALKALKAAVVWVVPKAIVESHAVSTVGRGLSIPIVTVQIICVEVLFEVYARPIHDNELSDLIFPIANPETIDLFQKVYKWSTINPESIDDDKHILCRRLAELLARFANTLEPRLEDMPCEVDLTSLLKLLYDILQDPSLIVSIPVLHSWTRILRSSHIRDLHLLAPLYPGLLDICSERLLRYESFPEDSDDPVITVLNEDIDTVPERHAFLGNYRRFCVDVIEVIIRQSPHDALQHVLQQAGGLLAKAHEEAKTFTPANFRRNSISFLRVDAYVTVLDSALRGYLKWLQSPKHSPPPASEQESIRNGIEDMLERWCQGIFAGSFGDPEIAKKMIQLLVTVATKGLPHRPPFAIKVLEYVIGLTSKDDPSYPLYSESVKSLEVVSTSEMQRLALAFADHFLGAYDELERRIQAIISSRSIDDKLRMGYLAILFIIVHRARNLPMDTKKARLREMMRPMETDWQSQTLQNSLASFDSFCNFLGLSGLVDFFTKHEFHKAKNWTEQPLDSDGLALQAQINSRFQEFPLRMTKALLSASTERVRRDSETYILSRELWSDVVPSILPSLLQMISHAQAFNNPENWSHLSPELQQVFSHVLTDRFWQSGISLESREDFFARIGGSRHTFEGFASTVRGTVRQIRELGYFIIYSLTAFPTILYSIPDLPVPLADAMFRNAHALSAHHVSMLLGVAAPVVELCPPERRADFLPPVVAALFLQLNRKIGTEWELVRENRAKQETTENEEDGLGDEMRKESILRQLTHSAVLLASNMLEYKKGSQNYHGQDMRNPNADQTASDVPLANFTMSNPSILEPVFVLLKTTLLAPDSRSSVLSARTFRAVIPQFARPAATSSNSHNHDHLNNNSTAAVPDPNRDIRTFCTTDLLRAAITALHDPLLVDTQRDVASLIAAIISLDPDSTGDPRAVLLSLPGLSGSPARVAHAIARMLGKAAANGTGPLQPATDRQQRAIVLDLLSSVRGVGIHELGRVDPRTSTLRSAATVARRRDAALDKWTQARPEDGGGNGGLGAGGKGEKEDDDGLDGVAAMFQS